MNCLLDVLLETEMLDIDKNQHLTYLVRQLENSIEGILKCFD